MISYCRVNLWQFLSNSHAFKKNSFFYKWLGDPRFLKTNLRKLYSTWVKKNKPGLAINTGGGIGKEGHLGRAGAGLLAALTCKLVLRWNVLSSPEAQSGWERLCKGEGVGVFPSKMNKTQFELLYLLSLPLIPFMASTMKNTPWNFPSHMWTSSNVLNFFKLGRVICHLLQTLLFWGS